jgi:hypothetical protein
MASAPDCTGPPAAVVPGGDLRRLAGAVVPHAARAAADPVLCAVQWEISGGALWLAAADGHTGAVARWPLPGRPAAATGAALLSPGQATALASFAAAGPRPVAVEVHAGSVTVTRADGTASGAQWPLPPPAPGRIPDWRDEVAGMLAAAPGPEVSGMTVCSAGLCRFRVQSVLDARVAGGWPASLKLELRQQQRSGSPQVLVTCEDWLIGYLRCPADHAGTPGGDDTAGGWLAWLAG